MMERSLAKRMGARTGTRSPSNPPPQAEEGRVGATGAKAGTRRKP
jgi:hypothetical protein